ncbi:MAG: rbsC 4 [Phycisphaerales bacterium]|nr:rbsC 4 [Phycisphaerales bacterium]
MTMPSPNLDSLTPDVLPAGPVRALSPSDKANWLRGLWDSAGMAVILIALMVVLSLTVPNFASVANFRGLALSVATVGMIACTMLFCLAGGDFDLSVGSTVAMSGVLSAVVSNATGSVTLGVAAGLGAGALVGLANGVVIARIGINALITTLAMMQIVRGLAYIICDGRPVGIQSDRFWGLGINSFAGLPVPVWIVIVCFIAFGILLNRTTFGRNTLAVGGNPEAARLAGIAVTRTKIIIFTMQGLAAAMAGIVLSARMTSGQPATAQGLELQVISACVLGGVSLTGGIGTITGVVVGVLIMGVVNNAMNLLNIAPFYQYVASGAILLAAVMVDRFKQSYSA